MLFDRIIEISGELLDWAIKIFGRDATGNESDLSSCCGFSVFLVSFCNVFGRTISECVRTDYCSLSPVCDGVRSTLVVFGLHLCDDSDNCWRISIRQVFLRVS